MVCGARKNILGVYKTYAFRFSWFEEERVRRDYSLEAVGPVRPAFVLSVRSIPEALYESVNQKMSHYLGQASAPPM